MQHPSVIEEGRLDGPAEGRGATEISLDVVGFREAERRALKAALVEMGQQLGVRFGFGGAASEVLVLEAAHALGLAPATRQALQAGRPLVLVLGADLLGGLRRAHDGRDLLNQLRRLPQLRARPA